MPSPTLYSFTIRDDAGVDSTHTIPVAFDAATETVGALIGNLAAYGGTLDAITDGQIMDARIIIDVAPDPSWKIAPVASSHVERTGLFAFSQEDSKYSFSLDVPAYKQSISVKDRIDLAAAAYLAWQRRYSTM